MKGSVRVVLILVVVVAVTACLLALMGPGISRMVSNLVSASPTPSAAEAPAQAVAVPSEPPPLPTAARQPTAAPLPSATRSPRATRSPTATAVPLASSTPVRPSAVVVRDTLNVRSGPSTDFPVIATLARGDELLLLGRTARGDWLQVELAGGERGWVWAEYTALNVPLDQVALVTDLPKPPTPVVTRTPAPPTATLTVDEQIAKIAKGEHGELGQPGASGGVSAGGEAEVTVINDTPHALTLLIGSPSSLTITIEACPVCKEYGAVGPLYCPEEGRTRTTVRLKPGTSQVVARVSDPSVIPFYGTWELRADTAYFNCFYISSTWR